MQSSANIESLIPFPQKITKFAYQKFQQAKSIFAVIHTIISARLAKTLVPKRETQIAALMTAATILSE